MNHCLGHVRFCAKTGKLKQFPRDATMQSNSRRFGKCTCENTAVIKIAKREKAMPDPCLTPCLIGKRRQKKIRESKHSRQNSAVKFLDNCYSPADFICSCNKSGPRPVISLRHQGGAKRFLKKAKIFNILSNSFKLCRTHFSR